MEANSIAYENIYKITSYHIDTKVRYAIGLASILLVNSHISYTQSYK